MTSKIRTALSHTKKLVLLCAALAALAAGPCAPIASAAENTGPVKEGTTRASEAQCSMYKNWYDGDLNAAKNAKTPEAKASAERQAAATKQLASDRGCNWAQARAVSKYGRLHPRTVGDLPTLSPADSPTAGVAAPTKGGVLSAG